VLLYYACGLARPGQRRCLSKYLKDKSEGKESVSNVEQSFNLSGTFKDHRHEILSPEFEVIYACSTDAALIKKKIKFSSYIRKGAVAKS
jgi:hypothetical protein